MASFNYLWKNRIKFKFFSVMFFKVWMKRLLLLKPIIYRNRVRKKLISYGADIHETAEIGKIICNGNPKNIKIGSLEGRPVHHKVFKRLIYIQLLIPLNSGELVSLRITNF